MLKIDSHQHFWKFDPVRDTWIDGKMSAIQRDFLPVDLETELRENDIGGCITVQSDQSEAENDFQLANAANHNFIKGVVGWVDLQADNVEDRLGYYSKYEKMKGFRHVLQGEADRAMMLKPGFMKGIKALKKHNFTYDILIFPDQLLYTKSMVKAFPDQKFVIDHIAKPSIKDGAISDWKKQIAAFAEYENVWCKVSGMVTEADWFKWKEQDFIPYLDVVFETFGAKRLMFGSDWPVCLLAGGYAKTISIVKNYMASFSQNEQEHFWGKNAAEFYNL